MALAAQVVIGPFDLNICREHQSGVRNLAVLDLLHRDIKLFFERTVVQDARHLRPLFATALDKVLVAAKVRCKTANLLRQAVVERQLLRLDCSLCRNGENVLHLTWLAIGAFQPAINGLRTVAPEEECAACRSLEFGDLRSFKVLDFVDNDEIRGRAPVFTPLMVVHEVVGVQTNRADAV